MKLESLLIKLTLLCLITINLNSCGIYRPVSAKDYPPEPEKRIKKIYKKEEVFKYLVITKKVGILILQHQMKCGEQA